MCVKNKEIKQFYLYKPIFKTASGLFPSASSVGAKVCYRD